MDFKSIFCEARIANPHQHRCFKVFEVDFKFSDLLPADEVFITSTTKGVLPIVKIDSHTISNGQIGKISKAIQKIIMSE